MMEMNVQEVQFASSWSFASSHNSGSMTSSLYGTLTLPLYVRDYFDLTKTQASIGGTTALGVVSLASGFVASASEAIDLWGLDDNLTIPILCGIGIGAFLWAFGGS